MESNHEIGDAVWKAITKLEMLYGRQSLRARMTGDVGKTSTKMGRETHGDEIFLTPMESTGGRGVLGLPRFLSST